MNIEELYKILSYGELINLSISGEGSGTIIESKKPTIIQHANEALLRLHSKFILKEKELIIQQSVGITEYNITENNTRSHGTSDNKFILDENDPYYGDAIKILSVYNENDFNISLNDPNDKFSYYTPKPLTLQVPAPREEMIIGVVYQARHLKLDIENEEQEIDLPDILVPALTAYIAHKIFSNMVGQEYIAKGVEQFEVYESICSEVVDQDLVNTSRTSTNEKFQNRGFV